MQESEILSFLCYYDIRNPEGVNDLEAINEHKEMITRKLKKRKQTEYFCPCDNCFYGRTLLATEILRLNQLINTKTQTT